MHKIESTPNVGGTFGETPPNRTPVGADWLNAVQNELRNVIEGAGLTLKGAGTETGDQLKAAIDILTQTSVTNYASDSEATDTYIITLDPAPTAYYTGMPVIFKANTINTGACTINVNGLGAKSIKVNVDNDPNNGDIQSGQMVSLIYDGTNFQMQSQKGPPALRIISLHIENATDANELKLSTTARFNGTTIGITNNIGKGETVDEFTLSADGANIIITNLGGNVQDGAAIATIATNASTDDDIYVYATGISNNLRVYFYNKAGTVKDMTAVVDVGDPLSISILYVTDA